MWHKNMWIESVRAQEELMPTHRLLLVHTRAVCKVMAKVGFASTINCQYSYDYLTVNHYKRDTFFLPNSSSAASKAPSTALCWNGLHLSLTIRVPSIELPEWIKTTRHINDGRPRQYRSRQLRMRNRVNQLIWRVVQWCYIGKQNMVFCLALYTKQPTMWRDAFNAAIYYV